MGHNQSMVIHVLIPESLEEAVRAKFGDHLERRVLEDLCVAWFNDGLISSGKLGEILGLSWVDAQAFLKSRGVVNQTTVEEAFADANSLRAGRELPAQ